ncbi:antibiotic biosynthesis monooxygenase family protein [Saccharibacillus alkalitolerans]|uniref:ABM domain-containing protein n=1 Tax=Saccharibacillus alkalitolerans TaxID=2705290 RepID=A0ABX0F0Q0_9BACL|nr:antibiotic biosynthesis monooxygenase [Saccharibacillus alkalitolerans]NGZ74556.1 hypothetical protein [Saccharibacillus alkalitolerans]
MNETMPEKRGVLRLQAGDGAGRMFQLAVMTVNPDELQHVLDETVVELEQALRTGIVHAGAVLRGTDGRDAAVLAHLSGVPGERRKVERLRLPADSNMDTDLFAVEMVGHIPEQNFSDLEEGSPMAHFVNVFEVAPGERKRMLEQFASIMPHVSKKDGYVSANVHFSLDGVYAANVGQFTDSASLESALGRPEVLAAFAKGAVSGALEKSFGILPKPPRFRRYEVYRVAGDNRNL